jgi:hypothetical protein
MDIQFPASRAATQHIATTEAEAEAADLTSFIKAHLSPLCHAQEKEARHHEAVKNQSLGEGL